MNILFIGDIMGRAGRNVIKSHLKEIQSEYQIDFTIANAENASGYAGLAKSSYDELMQAGIDFTTGNHVWAQKKFLIISSDVTIFFVPPTILPLVREKDTELCASIKSA